MKVNKATVANFATVQIMAVGAIFALTGAGGEIELYHQCTMSFILVPGAGIEPARCYHRGILSPLRLPIPPPGQDDLLVVLG